MNTSRNLSASEPGGTNVSLWHATCSLTDAGPIERCCEDWLDDSDRERADRFRRPNNRNQHVIGRGMARRLLADGLVQPHAIRFDAECYGKPFVREPQTAKRPFNVAHTDGLVMCGIADSDDSLIGVDVECLSRETDPELADRYFSTPEIEYLKGFQSAHDRQHAFLKIWTLKESYIKAIGTGLQTPLADFAFENIDSDRPSIRMLDEKLNDGANWEFFSLSPRPGFIGAIAIASPQKLRNVTLKLNSFDELIQ